MVASARISSGFRRKLRALGRVRHLGVDRLEQVGQRLDARGDGDAVAGRSVAGLADVDQLRSDTNLEVGRVGHVEAVRHAILLEGALDVWVREQGQYGA